MMILGKSLDDYVALLKRPVYLYVVALVVSSAVSFMSFELYQVTDMVTALLLLALSIYVGWKAPSHGFRWPNAVLAGIMFGISMGFIHGVVMSLLISNNVEVQKFMEPSIQRFIADAKENGQELTREETVGLLGSSAILFGIVIVPLITTVLSLVGYVAGKYLGRKRKEPEREGAGEEHEDAEVDEPKQKKRRKRGKKFRKRK